MFKHKSHFVRRDKVGNNKNSGNASKLNKLGHSAKLIVTSRIPKQEKSHFADEVYKSTFINPGGTEHNIEEGLAFSLEPERTLQRQTQSNHLMMMSASTML